VKTYGDILDLGDTPIICIISPLKITTIFEDLLDYLNLDGVQREFNLVYENKNPLSHYATMFWSSKQTFLLQWATLS